ncbi:MAG TPA: hypothetical protein VEZ90_09195, partial [Blastocatellia bacterium]|nr:hypothetical protein [Blastocatellia bacterium]
MSYNQVRGGRTNAPTIDLLADSSRSLAKVRWHRTESQPGGSRLKRSAASLERCAGVILLLVLAVFTCYSREAGPDAFKAMKWRLIG